MVFIRTRLVSLVQNKKTKRNDTHASFNLSFFILMRYCVILVILCLHLCVKNSGQ